MGGLRITGYLFFLISSVAWGATPAKELEKLFAQHFHNHYVDGRCGDNILKFARAIPDPEGLHIVVIENKGFSVFGMVNAETTRGERFKKPAVVESNWYHHVVLLDGDGRVYDFDYHITPTVMPIEEYIETMFLEEPECQTPRSGEFCGGRDNKLKEYQLESTPVTKALAREETPPRKATLGEVLKNWKVLLH